MKIGFFNESRLEQLHPERRVAVTPQAQTILAKYGVEWIGESGAGLSAGFKDEFYLERIGVSKAISVHSIKYERLVLVQFRQF